MLPPAPALSRRPARSRPSQVAKAARDPDEDDDEEEEVVVKKKPRSVKAGGGGQEEVEGGLEGGRLMDEMAEEQGKRSKVVGVSSPLL